MNTEHSSGPEYWKSRHGLKILVMLAIAFAAVVWGIGEIKSYKFIGSNPNTTRSITVTGQGKQYVRADVATVQVSVSSDAGPTNLAEVQDRNSRTANAVMALVKTQGVKEDDIKTLNYSISPRYNYSQNGQQFLGYTVRQDIQLKIRDLAQVGTILNIAVQRGANEVSNLQFTVDDPQKPQEDARNEAINDAKSNAEKLAKELGVRLVRLTNYSENAGGQPPIFYGAMADGKGGPAPEIQVGQNEIRSNVTLTYEIE
ncbi:MAG: SIMPL domain-containing protein [Candidatus Sungbacteria bacterium]|uniref:SIMPL domain-containing protein n=1 Tax=Candidatus Sungiibacteriota bacterium TaxID=2750080 RepID=A0A931SE63_9BACT|nr:SIMPL domain-containing protein [Candidatus Sungbacteria bacterium]